MEKNCIKDNTQQTDELKEHIENLEKLAETRSLDDAEREKRKSLKQKVKELEHLKNLDLKQKAKIKWTVDGDENTKFFHGMINSNKQKNRINGLLVNREWISSPEAIKEEAVNFFKAKATTLKNFLKKTIAG